MQVRQFYGRLSEILRCRIFLCVRIYWCCSHCSSSSYIVRVALWFRNLQTRSVFSGGPELPSMIPIICCKFISGSPDTRVMTECGIFTESTMLNNLQSIAQENHCQLLEFPETDLGHYISNHPWIDRLSRRYRGDVLYSKTRLEYSRLTQVYSRVFPPPGMKFKYTSNPLSCWRWWSQIWHRMHILFTSWFRQAATHY